jgi:TRAP-type mannitol/chloroaromatic compound transport system permease small subunit
VGFILGIVQTMEWFNERIGRFVAWFVLLMALNVGSVFFLRHIFSIEFPWLRDSYTWMHGVIFMAGAGYTLLNNGYLRIDLIYRSRNARFRALADLLGTFLFLVPFCAIFAWISWPYVESAWIDLDGVGDIGVLAGAVVLKSAVLLFCLLVGMQGIALAGRSILTLNGHVNEAKGAD